MREQQTVREFLDSVSVGEPLSYQQLALYPLWRKEADPFRVLIPDVSMVDLSLRSDRHTSVQEINSLEKRAFASYLEFTPGYPNDGVVSTDFIHDAPPPLRQSCQAAEQPQWRIEFLGIDPLE